MVTVIKLTHLNDVTRRLSFPGGRPQWDELAQKIGSLYSIPTDKVAVSYVDADSDTVTLSSDEELADYYRFVLKPGEVSKFQVLDLVDVRNSDKSLPETPRTTPGARHTFGNMSETGLPFDLEDWALPTVDGIYLPVGDNEPHGFVESVHSDESSVLSNDNEDIVEVRSAISHQSGQRIPTADKGKERAPLSNSSSASLLADKSKGRAPSSNSSTVSLFAGVASPQKPAVHVFGVKRSDGDQTPQRPASPVRSETTPRADPRVVTEDNETSKNTADDENDPPLPTLDEDSSVHSLPSDVATFLSNLSMVISSHPELSEGFRNILTNASNGAYWNAHRDAVREAAGQFSTNVSNDLQAIEAEAGRRVSEAIRELFRSFTSVAGSATAAAPTTNDPIPPAAPEFGTTSYWYRRHEHEHGFPFRGRRDFPGMRNEGSFRGGRRHFGFSPTGPPSMDGEHSYPPPPPPDFGGHHPRGPLPPHQGPPHPHQGPPPWRHHFPPGPPPMWHGPWDASSPPPPPPPPPPPEEAPPKPSPQELRAQVEAAKLLYKAEKARYRQEKEERRRTREREAPGNQTVSPRPPVIPPFGIQSPTSQPEPIQPPQPPQPSVLSRSNTMSSAHLVANAHGVYPQLEMFNVPRRNNTIPFGLAHRRAHLRPLRRESAPPTASIIVPPADDPSAKSLRHILKKLGDMGFTENAHPDLAARVQRQLPADGTTISREQEDDIVTNLLEGLIVASPRSNVASGSGVQHFGENLPGAWRLE